MEEEECPMRLQFLLSLLAMMLLASCASAAGNTVNGLPVHVEKLSGNAIRLWVGDYISSTAVSALSTDKGIVVIDSTESPRLDEHFRKVIAREFGRDDFAYLINTHEHADHTTGNGLYADCEIIAHEYCAEGMKAQRQDAQRIIEWYENRIPELEVELAGLEKGTEQYKKTNEDVIVKKMVLESLKARHELVFPTKTFTDRLKIDLGNMTVELYAMGGTHTASDIFVFVPEEGLLFTGDMMADIWLTDTPGCLQAFRMREGVRRDMPLLLENWKALLARKDEIRDYIPAHWNGDLTYQGFADRYAYLETMYNEVTKATKEGVKLEDLFADFNLRERFPNLAGTPGFTRDRDHYGSVVALWTDVTGAESASAALASMIEERGLKDAMAAFKAERAKGTDRYYFLEDGFNSLGYGYLNEEKYDEAIAIFKLNMELYPDSWNVYDSLGEAYMKSGKLDLAVNSYTRSLELNPDNENGRKMLEEMRTTTAQK
jgi:glyoxylase-like metal-dependent hydrolase (beta-lactamase superfamily II)